VKKTKIDRDYFLNYAGSKKPYDKVYNDHSYAAECIELFQQEEAPKLNRICVLGTATGKVLEDFQKAFAIYPYGCEINNWAWDQIRPKLKARIRNLDMREYVPMMLERKFQCDLVFSNSFIYLDESDLDPLFKQLSHMTKYIHFSSSFLGDACPDPYRKLLKSLAWWEDKLEKFGFTHRRTIFGKPSYLWSLK